MMDFDDATRAQIDAITPEASTWLSANAGSGKTRVLTTRVALLLLGEVDPQNILCLTYTKAAAAEMQNRLFKQLGSWAMMDDINLRKELRGLGVAQGMDAERLRLARTLFAAAIETPGGLRIQTIHSFCSALLRRFPLEAGVTPLFRELDDRAARDLYEQILRDMARGSDEPALRGIARLISDPDLTELAKAVAGKRAAYAVARTAGEIRADFGLQGEPQLDHLTAQLFTPDRVDLIRRLVKALEGSSANDQKVAVKLAALNVNDPGADDLDIVIDAFVFGPGTKSNPLGPKAAGRGQVMVGDLRKAMPDLAAEADAYMELVADLRPVIHAERAAARTIALEDFAQAFLKRYADAKAAGGWLDFDDLIEKATGLLSDDAVAPWVMYRLDGGIDHILVDEAQDTSPAQWAVIRLLAQNFGQDASDPRNRTLFVVGDPKQSIYSFQGADPAEFDNMRDYFDARLADLGQTLHNRALHHSFRSSAAILNVVDNVIGELDGSGFTDADHIAFKADMPGRVDIWPVRYEKVEKDDPEWFNPIDLVAPDDDKVVLAEAIAEQIRAMVGTPIPDGKGGFRPIHAGDVLILVQRRSDLFHEVIRACKGAGLQVAGADRLKLSGELAVKDLKALMAFCALPQDELSLAAALRSPLFGLTEQDLFTLAHRRSKTPLWRRLVARQDTFPEQVAMLSDLMRQADLMSPYDFLERALTRWGGRIRMMARLGVEAGEGVDALLSLARDYEATGPASLTGFLAWLDVDETEIKRQAESAGDKIRVMTTHGAKGLESPIVILPETHEARGNNRVKPLITDDGHAIWPSPGAEHTDLSDAAKSAEADMRAEERLRLLYVAMTRAEKWLIICGAGKDASNDKSWHTRMWNAVEKAGATPISIDRIGEGLRHQHGDWAVTAVEPESTKAPVIALPGWARDHAPAPPPRQTIINPSKLGQDAAETLAGRGDTQFAAQRGTAIHLLLEELPLIDRPDWRDAGKAILATRVVDLPDDHNAGVLDEALAVLNHPDFGHIFAPDTLAEVAVSASAGPGERIAGVIDRLIVSDTDVTIVDFKSHSAPPEQASDVPVEILMQMSAYRHAIAQTFPNHRINMQILWTARPQLMTLPHDIVMNAAVRQTIS